VLRERPSFVEAIVSRGDDGALFRGSLADVREALTKGTLRFRGGSVRGVLPSVRQP
jgi:hypothetical protein